MQAGGGRHSLGYKEWLLNLPNYVINASFFFTSRDGCLAYIDPWRQLCQVIFKIIWKCLMVCCIIVLLRCFGDNSNTIQAHGKRWRHTGSYFSIFFISLLWSIRFFHIFDIISMQYLTVSFWKVLIPHKANSHWCSNMTLSSKHLDIKIFNPIQYLNTTKKQSLNMAGLRLVGPLGRL